MKNKKWLFGLIILIIISFAGLTLGKAFFLNSLKENKLILFYSLSCPHCKAVDEYIKASGLDGKVNIVRAEVSLNRKNANDLYIKAEACGMNMSQGLSVPFLWDDGRCVVGDKDIISYFKEAFLNEN